jgi:hemolysin-activating ACP:hemolysin acyltransferase
VTSSRAFFGCTGEATSPGRPFVAARVERQLRAPVAKPPSASAKNPLDSPTPPPPYAAALGLVAMLHEQVSEHSDISLEVLLKGVRIPYRLKQMKIYTTGEGCPLGYLAWAWATSATLDRLRTEPLSALHVSEWREGSHLFVAELVAVDGALPQIVADVRNHLFAHEPDIFWCSRHAIRDERLRIWRRR